MSQQYCYVCSGFDFDFDEEIGAMRCSNCFTLSQTFQEHNTEDMVGVTVIGTHNAAVLGFVREKDTSRKEREAAEMEEKRQRITSTVPEEEAHIIASNYISGIQKILEAQCQFLAQELFVSPHVFKISSKILGNLVEKSEVLKKNWAEKLALQVEKAYLEERSKGGEKEEMNGKSGNIEVDLGEESQENELLVKFSGSGARKLDHGSIAYEVWLYEIKRRLPVKALLSICFLGCHLAREPILPIEICHLALSGDLPYLTAWIDLPDPSSVPSTVPGHPSGKAMWRPKNVPSGREVEWMAGQLALRLDIQMPPVNFWLVAQKLLWQVGLPLHLRKHLMAPLRRLLLLLPHHPCHISASSAVVPTGAHVAASLVILLKLTLHLSGSEALEESGGGKKGKRRGRERGKAVEEETPGEDVGKILRSLVVPAAPFRSPPGWQPAGRQLYHPDALREYLTYCRYNLYHDCTRSASGERLQRILWKIWSPDEEETHRPESTKVQSYLDTQESAVDRSFQNFEGENRGESGEEGEEDEEEEEGEGEGEGEGEVGSENQESSWNPVRSVPVVPGLWGRERVERAMEESGFCLLTKKEHWKKDCYLLYKPLEETSLGSSQPIPVHPDYFVLLWAFSKWLDVSPGALHRAVQEREEDLRDVEGDWEDTAKIFRNINLEN